MDRRPPAQRRAMLAVLCLCFFSIALDNAKLVTAAPTLARLVEAGIPPAARADATRTVTWILEAGLLVYASLLLLGGALCERYGPRRTLLVGLAVFAGGSTLAAWSDPRSTLVWARAAMGAGGALMTPATLAAIRHAFTGHERSRAVAWWTASFGLGAAAGPLVGGLLLETRGFASLMLVNVPPAVVAFAAARMLLPERSPRREAPLDFVGTALAFAGTLSLLTAILHGPSHGWAARHLIGPLAAAALLYFALFAWERRVRHPLVDLALFRRPRFVLTLLLILLGYLAFSGVSFVVAQYWQVARSYRPVQGGLLAVPLAASMLAGTLLAPAVTRRAGPEGALVSSLIVATAGAALLAWAAAHLDEPFFAAAEVPVGAGFGSAFANATEVVLGSVSAERAGSAAAASETAFELGGALGVAILSATLGAPRAAAAAGDALSGSASMALGTGAAAALLSTCIALAIAWLARESRQRGAHGVRIGEPRRPDEKVPLGSAGRGENRGAESGAGDPT